jgi:hypothetical protein
MNRLLFVAILLAIFFGLVAYFYKNQAEEQERLKDVYCANNQVLITRIKKVYDDKVATDRKIRELEQRAKEDLVFDWNVDISSSPVILELKK